MGDKYLKYCNLCSKSALEIIRLGNSNKKMGALESKLETDLINKQRQACLAYKTNSSDSEKCDPCKAYPFKEGYKEHLVA